MRRYHHGVKGLDEASFWALCSSFRRTKLREKTIKAARPLEAGSVQGFFRLSVFSWPQLHLAALEGTDGSLLIVQSALRYLWM